MLCVDTESLRYPELIGLNDEDIDSQEWLETYSSAHEARRALSGAGQKDNVWVVSCDDMEGINLAAPLNAMIQVGVSSWSLLAEPVLRLGDVKLRVLT